MDDLRIKSHHGEGCRQRGSASDGDDKTGALASIGKRAIKLWGVSNTFASRRLKEAFTRTLRRSGLYRLVKIADGGLSQRKSAPNNFDEIRLQLLAFFTHKCMLAVFAQFLNRQVTTCSQRAASSSKCE
jgi:hypothetical protein